MEKQAKIEHLLSRGVSIKDIHKIAVNALGWIKIPGSRDYYVSREGQVGKRLDENVYKILKDKRHPAGYVQQNIIMEDGSRLYFTVHKLVAEAFIGKRPKNLVINHKNGVKTDNRVENLEYVTRSENQKHAYRTGLHGERKSSGVNHFKAKLTEAAVKMIYECQSLSNNEMATVFGVDPNVIKGIKKGTCWKHITLHGVQLPIIFNSVL